MEKANIQFSKGVYFVCVPKFEAKELCDIVLLRRGINSKLDAHKPNLP